jgi:hypothetical protein
MLIENILCNHIANQVVVLCGECTGNHKWASECRLLNFGLICRAKFLNVRPHSQTYACVSIDGLFPK